MVNKLLLQILPKNYRLQSVKMTMPYKRPVIQYALNFPCVSLEKKKMQSCIKMFSGFSEKLATIAIHLLACMPSSYRLKYWMLHHTTEWHFIWWCMIFLLYKTRQNTRCTQILFICVYAFSVKGPSNIAIVQRY